MRAIEGSRCSMIARFDSVRFPHFKNVTDPRSFRDAQTFLFVSWAILCAFPLGTRLACLAIAPTKRLCPILRRAEKEPEMNANKRK